MQDRERRFLQQNFGLDLGKRRGGNIACINLLANELPGPPECIRYGLSRLKLRLSAAQRQVVSRHLRGHADLDAASVLNRLVNASFTGFHAALRGAEEVELPTRVEADIVDGLVAVKARNSIDGQRPVPALPAPRNARLRTDIRVATACGDASQRSSFRNPRTCLSQIEILRQCALNESIENRVIEISPPVGDV